MIRFFRGTGPGPIVVLALFAVALWAEYFISPPAVIGSPAGEPMPLWEMIMDKLTGLPLLQVTISFIMMIVVAVVMVRFNTSVFFIPRRTLFPALFFMLLYSAFPGEMVLNPALPAALLILIGLWRMISAYRLTGMTYNFFDAALLISAAGMFYAGSVWFLLLVLIGVLTIKSPDIRDIAIILAGAVLPWMILYAVWFITGESISDLNTKIHHNLFDQMPQVYWSRTLIILLCVTALNFLPALFSLVMEMPTQKIRSRKAFELLLWMMTICAAAYIFVPAVSAEMNVLTAIPVSYIMANHCVFTRRTVVTEILFWSLVMMVTVTRLWPY